MTGWGPSRLEDFVGAFEAVFRTVSVPTVVPFLTYSAKWQLLIATLLGHPPVGGLQRPRDFPMSPVRSDTLRLAEILCGTESPFAWESAKPVGAGWSPARSYRPMSAVPFRNMVGSSES